MCIWSGTCVHDHTDPKRGMLPSEVKIIHESYGVENQRQSIDTSANDLHQMVYPFDMIYTVYMVAHWPRSVMLAQLSSYGIYVNIIFSVRYRSMCGMCRILLLANRARCFTLYGSHVNNILLFTPCARRAYVNFNVHSNNMIKMHFKYSVRYMWYTSLRLRLQSIWLEFVIAPSN